MSEPTVVAFPQGYAPPPEHFAPAEAELWRAVIGSRPIGHFGPEVFPLIEAYCTTAMACDLIAGRMRDEDDVDHALLETYGKMTDTLIDLAAALGLLPQGGERRTRDAGA
jgi:hypothetical protein